MLNAILSIGKNVSLSSGLSLSLIALLFIGLSQAGLSVYHFLNRLIKFPPNNEVAGILFGAISLIYSLVLAFVIVAVWEDYNRLNQTIGTETDKLNGIIAHSALLPDSIKGPVRTTLTAYCNEVIGKEWEMKETADSEGVSAIPGLRLLLLRLEPQTKVQESVLNVLDSDLSSITELRRNRLAHNRSQIPDAVWLILRTGSIMLILFFYLFSVPSEGLKRVYLFFLSGCIVMCLILVHTLDQPFTGNARVSQKPYVDILAVLQKEKTINHQ